MPTKPTHILLIDDDPELTKVIVDEARNYRFIVSAFNNLKQGIDFLEKHQKIKAVVLDSRCALDEEQKPDSIKTNFVFQAMEDIKEIKHRQDRLIPFCVFSDKTFDLHNDLDGIAPVFNKSDGFEPLFQYLQTVVGQLPEMLVREKFDVVFGFIADFMTDEDDDLMESLLMKGEQTDPTTIISNLTLVRRLLEKLFDILSVNVMATNPWSFDHSGQSRTRSIMDALTKNNLLPYALKNKAGDVYAFTSKYGSHNQTEKHIKYHPGSYAVQANIFYLLELFMWASQCISNLSKQ